MLSLKDINIYEGEVLETNKGHRFIVLLNLDSPHIKLANLKTGQVISFDKEDLKQSSIISKVYRDYKCDIVVWSKPDLSIECEDTNEYNYLDMHKKIYNRLLLRRKNND